MQGFYHSHELSTTGWMPEKLIPLLALATGSKPTAGASPASVESSIHGRGALMVTF
jgi:hypothetical protein